MVPGAGEDNTANMPSKLVPIVGGGSGSGDGDSLHPSPSSFLNLQSLTQKTSHDILAPPSEEPHSLLGAFVGT